MNLKPTKERARFVLSVLIIVFRCTDVCPVSLHAFRRIQVTCPVSQAAQRLSGAHQQCCLKGRLSRSQSIPNIVNGVNHLRAGTHYLLSNWYQKQYVALQTHNTQVQMQR